MRPLRVSWPKFLAKMRIFPGKDRLFEMGLQPYPIVILIGCIDSEPGLFTSRGYGSSEEAACEGVVFYVEQAAT
jgi:hypothetical protein